MNIFDVAAKLASYQQFRDLLTNLSTVRSDCSVIGAGRTPKLGGIAATPGCFTFLTGAAKYIYITTSDDDDSFTKTTQSLEKKQSQARKGHILCLLQGVNHHQYM